MSLLLLFRPSISADQTVTATAGILRLVGGTHTATASSAVTGTAGILRLVGGTHTVTGDEVFVLKIRTIMGTGL